MKGFLKRRNKGKVSIKKGIRVIGAIAGAMAAYLGKGCLFAKKAKEA
ncbi:MAG: hypothetical protein ACRCWR_06875 [Saezia sp.]